MKIGRLKTFLIYFGAFIQIILTLSEYAIIFFITAQFLTKQHFIDNYIDSNYYLTFVIIFLAIFIVIFVLEFITKTFRKIDSFIDSLDGF